MIRALALMAAWLAALCVWTVGGAYVGWTYLTPVAHEKQPVVRTTMPKPVHWTKRTALCFFVGKPGYDRRACGDVRMSKWETYCEPDPNCMELPDGTNYANEITRGPDPRAAGAKGLPYRGDEPLRGRR